VRAWFTLLGEVKSGGVFVGVGVNVSLCPCPALTIEASKMASGEFESSGFLVKGSFEVDLIRIIN
jgi:hypothetical protein